MEQKWMAVVLFEGGEYSIPEVKVVYFTGDGTEDELKAMAEAESCETDVLNIDLYSQKSVNEKFKQL